MLKAKEPTAKLPCPYCSSGKVICKGTHAESSVSSVKNCWRIFVPTTNTIMASSHFPISAWKEMIADTIHGNAIDYSAKRLGLYYQAAFNMCHKKLLALQELPEAADVCLVEVSEFDKTFVLDCYKDRKLDNTVNRAPRKHGTKAEKSGISNEYLLYLYRYPAQGGSACGHCQPRKAQ